MRLGTLEAEFTDEQRELMRVCRKVGTGTVRVFVKHGIPTVAKTNLVLLGKESPSFYDEYRLLFDELIKTGWGEVEFEVAGGKPLLGHLRGERHWHLDKK